MRFINATKLSIYLVTALVIISCNRNENKQEKGVSDSTVGKNPNQTLIDTSSSEKAIVDSQKKAISNSMNEVESEILDKTITAYELNAEDLIQWSKVADEATNVNEAVEVMMEYVEVQRRFNDNIKEIEKYADNELGKDYVYSSEYENTFQGYLSDPNRMTRSKQAVNATMRLINNYGSDKRFEAILKDLEKMNRYKMKELEDNQDDSK